MTASDRAMTEPIPEAEATPAVVTEKLALGWTHTARFLTTASQLVHLPPTELLMPATNDILQEFADMLATIARASADNAISEDEAKTIRRRWEELKSVTESFVKAAESGAFGAKP